MSSEDSGQRPAPGPPGASPGTTPAPPAHAPVPSPAPPPGGAVPAGGPGGAAMEVRKLTDPRAMRALAHPLRLSLLEALAHAGTLTATQASELLGESPATCAFHLRTLARYGYVEEAGGGSGRQRPWRRVHQALNITSRQDDERAALAAGELGRFWLDLMFDRARSALSRRGSWPASWQHAGTGQSQTIAYLTPSEAEALMEEMLDLLQRFGDRVDHPERRPPDAIPVEILVLAYPLLHLIGWPGAPGPQLPPPVPADPSHRPEGFTPAGHLPPFP
jgi:DNA-binding transcriptional ArsR family regulator